MAQVNSEQKEETHTNKVRSHDPLLASTAGDHTLLTVNEDFGHPWNEDREVSGREQVGVLGGQGNS